MTVSSKSKVYFFFESRFTVKRKTLLKQFIQSIVRNEQRDLDSLNIIFCTDHRLLEINKQYLAHDFYTDVITFEINNKSEAILGEIYISTDRIRENSKLLGVSVVQELNRVIFHGVLHLCGYNDKSAKDIKLMRAKEDTYLKDFQKFKI